MSTANAYTILMMMALILFLAGLVMFVSGLFILAMRASSKDVKVLSTQTANIARKGLAEDMAGLVGNASALMDAMNQLIRTTAGVGVFLTLLGLFTMLAASFMAFKIWMAL